jgi:predicted ATP-dependent serine protease
MIGMGLKTLIRFLVGIFLLQGVTGLLVYTALNTDWHATWPLFSILGGSVGAMVALLFGAMVDSDRRHAVAKATERFGKEREQLRVKAEQQRAKEIRNHEREVAKALKSGGGGLFTGGMNVKSVAMVGGAVGVGLAMMLTQFVTLGLLTLTTAGGAVLGYGARMRQEKLIAGRRLAAEEKRLRVIEADTLPQIEDKGRRARLTKEL